MKHQHSLSLVLNFMSIIGCLSIESCGINTSGKESQISEAWDAANNPTNMLVTLTKFQDLPTKGRLPPMVFPWSGSYWPTYRGGITQRWQTTTSLKSENYKDYRYKLQTNNKIKSLKQEELDLLSPAEKFDIAFERYDFPLVKREWNEAENSVSLTSQKIPTWEGICNGWAPASLMEKEPGNVASTTNKDGIKINFFSGDLKALLSSVYSFGNDRRVLGERCETNTNQIEVDQNGRLKEPECRDVNPGALHLLLAQNLGKRQGNQRGNLVMDMSRNSEVWNQPLIGYEVKSSVKRQYLPANDPQKAFRAPGTAFIIDVKTDLYYLGESETQRASFHDNNQSFEKTMQISYSLEVDRNDNVIGGEWTSVDHPDFLWQLLERPKQTDPLLNPQDVFRISRLSE